MNESGEIPVLNGPGGFDFVSLSSYHSVNELNMH